MPVPPLVLVPVPPLVLVVESVPVPVPVFEEALSVVVAPVVVPEVPVFCEVEVDPPAEPSSLVPMPLSHAVRARAARVTPVAASRRTGRAVRVVRNVRMVDPFRTKPVEKAENKWSKPRRSTGVPGAACLDDQSLWGDPSRPPQPTDDQGRWNVRIGFDLRERLVPGMRNGTCGT